MLTKKERGEQRHKFIRSDKFGSITFILLMLFRINVLGIISTIRLYESLYPQLDDKNFIKHDLSAKEIIGIKQYMSLDLIYKTISLIETLFVLIDSLSKNYEIMKENMTHYKTSLVWDIIKNINEKKYDMPKILAFLSVENFDLTKDEKCLLKKLYDETCITAYKTLANLADFYSRYNIVYNKSKHGLMFKIAMFNTEQPHDFEHSSAVFYDNKKQNQMPHNYIKSKTKESAIDMWFNAEALLNFNDKLLNEINVILNDLEALSKYISDNHLNFTNNCGISYLPYIKRGQSKSILFFTQNELTDDEKSTLESIQRKVTPEMVVSDYEIKLSQTFEDPELQQSIKENAVTNIWLENN